MFKILFYIYRIIVLFQHNKKKNKSPSESLPSSNNTTNEPERPDEEDKSISEPAPDLLRQRINDRQYQRVRETEINDLNDSTTSLSEDHLNISSRQITPKRLVLVILCILFVFLFIRRLFIMFDDN